MNTTEIEKIALKSVSDPIGCGIPELAVLNSMNPYYRFLYNIVQFYKPAFVVECGVDTAGSSLHMLWGNPTTQVIGLDRVVNENADLYRKIYPNFTLLVGDTVRPSSVDEIKRRCSGVGIGLLFLDSEHDGITPRREFNQYFPLFAEECLVLLDDISLNASMKKFWQDFPGEKMDLSMLHGSGFGASLFKK